MKTFRKPKTLVAVAMLMLVSFAGGRVAAQVVTSSGLPIVLIVTDTNPSTGQPYDIPDEPKVGASMKILYVDDTTTNYLSDQNNGDYINYKGRIGIETRGSTSQLHNKKPYGFETRMADDSTNRNVSLVGLPAENDWILTPMNDENSYIRDCLSYALGRRMGRYAPRTKYCEVFVNGDYRGLYFLTEKIKIDDGRVDLAKLDEADTTWPSVSGGYIIKADKTTGGDTPAWTTPAHDYYEDVLYIFHNPKPDRIAPAQAAYIESYFDSLQTAMDNGDTSLAHGYPSLIDVPSFIDYMIMGELSSNVDIYQKSTFFYKERLGKLCAGPLWDFNLAYGNDLVSWGYGRSGYNVWQFDNGDNTGSEFWYQLFNEPHFKSLFARRWHQLTDAGGVLCYDSVSAVMDSLQAIVDNYTDRDKQRWNRHFSHTASIASMRNWLQARYNWINSQLQSVDTVALSPLPQLVISKINYHPAAAGGYSEKQLEFIGVANAGGVEADLTGLYMREAGLGYQFPAGATLAAGDELFIVADTAAFRNAYDERPFGQFARHLSNSSQRLVLADAWGRTIDSVEYQDHAPWPTAADGHGSYLLLDDLSADNALASAWSAATALHVVSQQHHIGQWHSADTIVGADTIVVDTLFTADTLITDTLMAGTGQLLGSDTTVSIDTTVTQYRIGEGSGIAAAGDGVGAMAYPQPTTGHLTIVADGPIASYALYTVQGQRLMAARGAGGNRAAVDMTAYPSGVYLLRVQTDGGIAIVRVVKK